MATETRSFGTFANDNSSGTAAWSVAGNAATSNNSYATANLSAGQNPSQYLKATNSSHLSGSTLNSGDTINSIKYRVERNRTGSNDCKDEKLYPVEGGSIVTTTNFADTGTTWPVSTDSVAEYTQVTNLPSAATILASNWGFVLSAQLVPGVSSVANVDYMEVIIDFTPAATPIEEPESNVVVQKWAWDYRQLIPRFDEHVCPGIQMGIPLLTARMQLPPIGLQFSYAINLPTLAAPMRVVPLAPGTGIACLLNIPTLTLALTPKPLALSYATMLALPVLSLRMRTYGVAPIYNLAFNLPTLSMRIRPRQLSPAFGFVLNIPKLNLRLISHAPLPGFITPSLAPYVESQRSSAAEVIYGSSPGPFKLNLTATSWRRAGRVHVVHTGPVKPRVCTVEAQFTLATAFPNLAAGEFVYERLDGYLKIVNLDDMSDALVPDGDTFAIDTSPADAPLAPMLVTIEQIPTVL